MSIASVGELDLTQIRDQTERLVAAAPSVKLGKLAITKAGTNPQTAFDLLVDKYLNEGLTNILDVPIVSEEDARGADPDVAYPRWVNDPVDGTFNAMVGEPTYATSVALQTGPRNVALGVAGVRSPNFEILSAIAGQGARLNGESLVTAERGVSVWNKGTRVVAFGIPGDAPRVADRMAEAMRSFCNNEWNIRQLGSACLDICNVAAGRWHAFFEYGLYFWDFAAAKLIAEEAGCVIRVVPAQAATPEASPTFDIIVARNPDVLEEVAEYTGIKA